MIIFRGDEDRFELRALQLELEQRHRLENGGFHRDFWSSRYEQMQSFLIERYRGMSKTYICGGPIVEHRTEEQTQRLPRIAQANDPTSGRGSTSERPRTARAS